MPGPPRLHSPLPSFSLTQTTGILDPVESALTLLSWIRIFFRIVNAFPCPLAKKMTKINHSNRCPSIPNAYFYRPRHVLKPMAQCLLLKESKLYKKELVLRLSGSGAVFETNAQRTYCMYTNINFLFKFTHLGRADHCE